MGSAVLGEAITAIRAWSTVEMKGAAPGSADSFGSLVFNDTVQQARLPKPVYQALRRTITHGDSLDMSFSGVKTAVRYFVESDEGANAAKEDVAASFQAAVVDVLMQRLEAAFERGPYTSVVLSGGVAANTALQQALRNWGKRMNVPVFIPPPKYCTDNAAMIAAAAAHQGDAVLADPLSLSADPNLPFELSS